MTSTDVEDPQHTPFVIPEGNPIEAPNAPNRNRNTDAETDIRALIGVAPEVIPSDFVSQNYETLAALIREKTKRRSNQSIQSRLNFDQDDEASPSHHRKKRPERDDRRPPVFNRVGRRVGDDEGTNSEYFKERG